MNDIQLYELDKCRSNDELAMLRQSDRVYIRNLKAALRTLMRDIEHGYCESEQIQEWLSFKQAKDLINDNKD